LSSIEKQTMAERSNERADSISSSVTEAETFDGSVGASSLSTTDGAFTKLKAPEEMEIGDDLEERAGLLPAEQQDEKPQPSAQDNSTRTAVIWMVVNTLATIGIVSVCDLQMEPLG
jgi:solute carrier family 35 protein E3